MRWALAALLLGCAPRHVPAEMPPPEPERPAPPAVHAPAPPEGTISRRELDAVLAAGPAQFLDRVRVKAFRPDGRFRGWEVVGFGMRGDPIARFVTLGDVVGTVNGKPVERPEQFSEIWEGLRGASSVTVELTRRGEPLRLVFPVVGP